MSSPDPTQSSCTRPGVLPGVLQSLDDAASDELLAIGWGPGADGPAPWGTAVSVRAEPQLRLLGGGPAQTLPPQLGTPVIARSTAGDRSLVVVLRPEEVDKLVLGTEPPRSIGLPGGVYRDPRFARSPLEADPPLSVLELRDGRWALAVFVPVDGDGPWRHRPIDVSGPPPLEHACLVGHEDRHLLIYKAHVPGAARPAADGSLPAAPEPAMGTSSLGILHAVPLDAELRPQGDPFRLVDHAVFAFDVDRVGDRLIVVCTQLGGLSVLELSLGRSVPSMIRALSLACPEPLCSPAVLGTDAEVRCLVLASPGCSRARVLALRL